MALGDSSGTAPRLDATHNQKQLPKSLRHLLDGCTKQAPHSPDTCPHQAADGQLPACPLNLAAEGSPAARFILSYSLGRVPLYVF